MNKLGKFICILVVFTLAVIIAKLLLSKSGIVVYWSGRYYLSINTYLLVQTDSWRKKRYAYYFLSKISPNGSLIISLVSR